MNGKITIQLDKESIQRLEKDAIEWGLSIEDYARILLRGNRPAFMNMTPEEKEVLQETIKTLLNQSR